MITPNFSGRPPDNVRGAFSLLEVIVSTFIVGILLVVAMQTAGSVASGQLRSAEQGRARLLAAELMGEILRKDYQEPVDTPLFGAEPGESVSGTRTDYDDGDSGDLTLTFTDGARSLAFTLHNAEIVSISEPIQGPGVMTQEIELRGYADNTDSGLTVVYTNSKATYATA